MPDYKIARSYETVTLRETGRRPELSSTVPKR